MQLRSTDRETPTLPTESARESARARTISRSLCWGGRPRPVCSARSVPCPCLDFRSLSVRGPSMWTATAVSGGPAVACPLGCGRGGGLVVELPPWSRNADRGKVDFSPHRSGHSPSWLCYPSCPPCCPDSVVSHGNTFPGSGIFQTRGSGNRRWTNLRSKQKTKRPRPSRP